MGKRFTKQLIAFNKSFKNAWESMKYLMNVYKDNPAENKLLHNWFKTKGFVSKENIENFFKEKNLTFKKEQVKLKYAEFIENIKRLNPNYRNKTEDDMVKEQIAENLRLLYVAVTRAKKFLCITASRKNTSFGKVIEQEPNIIFTELLNCREVSYD